MTGAPDEHAHPEYDAELRDWSLQWIGPDIVAVGRIYHDSKRRWPDAHAIVTSQIIDGEMQPDGVIRTLNTRYRLIGPAGDFGALLKQGRDLMANGERRQRVASEERLFDLLSAAWGLEDSEFETVAGLPERWMWEWRHHYRAARDEDLAIARRLMSFHEALGLIVPPGRGYAKWWRRRWPTGSLLGERTPLEAVQDDGTTKLDQLEGYLRSSWNV